MRETQRARWQLEKERMQHAPPPTPPPSHISVNCGVKVDTEQIAQMPRKNIEVFMNGIAQILATQEAK